MISASVRWAPIASTANARTLASVWASVKDDRLVCFVTQLPTELTHAGGRSGADPRHSHGTPFLVVVSEQPS